MIEPGLINDIIKQTITEGHWLVLIVRGTSMTPFLKENDRVVVQPIGFQEIGLGDVIAFRNHDVIFTHRVIQKKGDYLITKGDNCVLSDPVLSEEYVLGKVVALERNGQQVQLSRKIEIVNVFLGYCHRVVGMVGQISQTALRLTRGRYRRLFSMMTRSLIIVVHLMERILLYGSRIEKSNP